MATAFLGLSTPDDSIPSWINRTPLSLMDSRRYRSPDPPSSYVDAHRKLPSSCGRARDPSCCPGTSNCYATRVFVLSERWFLKELLSS
jgi:hypothetical protein